MAALLSIGLLTSLSCGGGETDDPEGKAARAGFAGVGGYAEDFGGAGGGAGRAGAGGKPVAGQGGDGGGAGKGGTGGSGLAGAGGVSPSGGAAGGLVCPTTSFQPLPSCEDNDLPPCFACLCTTTDACKEAYSACETDPGCSKTIDCGRSGCSYTDCAQLAGSGLKKALDVRQCVEITCSAACDAAMGGGGNGGSSAVGGASGAGSGDGGSGGEGGSTAGAGAGGGGDPGETKGGAAGSSEKPPVPPAAGGAAGLPEMPAP